MQTNIALINAGKIMLTRKTALRGQYPSLIFEENPLLNRSSIIFGQFFAKPYSEVKYGKTNASIETGRPRHIACFDSEWAAFRPTHENTEIPKNNITALLRIKNTELFQI